MRSFCGENAIDYILKRSFAVDPRLAGTRRSHNAYTQLIMFHLGIRDQAIVSQA